MAQSDIRHQQFEDWLQSMRHERNMRVHGLSSAPEAELPLWTRVRHAADERGFNLTWDTVNEVAAFEDGGRYSLPGHVCKLYRALAHQLRASLVLDPWVTAPALVGSLVDGGPVAEGVGVVPDALEPMTRAVDSDVAWIVGHPVQAITYALNGAPFDLIVCAAPFDNAPSISRTDPNVEPGGMLWAWVAERVAGLVRSGVPLAMLLPIHLLFWRRDKEDEPRVQRILADQGVHLQACVQVQQAFAPGSPVSGAVALFGPEPREEIFAALLTPDQDPDQLAENLIAAKPGRVPELGCLVPRLDFRGWEALESQITLQRRLGIPSKYRATLGDVATDITRLDLSSPDDATAAPGAAIFLHQVRGKASTEPPERQGKGHVPVYQVSVDLSRAVPEYLVWWLNSSAGELARGALSDGVVPRLSRKNVGRLLIPLPAVEEQYAALALHARVTEMQVELSALQEELVERPTDARDLTEELDGLWSDPISVWLSRLPFPLSSILDRYRAVAAVDVSARRERLRHFFQAFAVFGVSLLLPAYQRVEPEWKDYFNKMAAKARGGTNPIKSPTFGSWVQLGASLAKALRREQGRLVEEMDSGDEVGGRKVANTILFGIADQTFADELTSKELWTSLSDANQLRNDSSHDRVLTVQEANEHLFELEQILERVREATPRCFVRTTFVVPGESRFDQGVNTYARAKHLTGPSPNFREAPVESLIQLESGALYAISSGGTVVQDALKVAPFVQLLPAPAHEANTVYFANGVGASGLHDMVSYHSEVTAHREEAIPELDALVADLDSRPADSTA